MFRSVIPAVGNEQIKRNRRVPGRYPSFFCDVGLRPIFGQMQSLSSRTNIGQLDFKSIDISFKFFLFKFLF